MTLVVEVPTMPADALRQYIRTLREGRGATQGQVAKAAGMAFRTYVDWEAGDTREIKGSPLLRIIAFLQGSFAALEQLAVTSAAPQDGERLAQSVLDQSFVEEIRAQALADAEQMTDTKLDEEIAFLRRLLDDPGLLRTARAYTLLLHQG